MPAPAEILAQATAGHGRLPLTSWAVSSEATETPSHTTGLDGKLV